MVSVKDALLFKMNEKSAHTLQHVNIKTATNTPQSASVTHGERFVDIITEIFVRNRRCISIKVNFTLNLMTTAGRFR